MSYKIIAQNTKFLVISKNVGTSFQGVEGILNHLRNDGHSVHGVHRLDQDTSGLMLFAKDKQTQKELSLLFQERQVEKTYIALSDKKPGKKMGEVKGDLVKTRGGSYKLTRSQNNPSLTQFKSFYCAELKMRGFILYPKTGKTHQLRVVLKSLGSPILGDKRYGGTMADRMYLHAYSLKFSFHDQLYQFTHYPDQGVSFQQSYDCFNSNIV